MQQLVADMLLPHRYAKEKRNKIIDVFSKDQPDKTEIDQQAGHEVKYPFTPVHFFLLEGDGDGFSKKIVVWMFTQYGLEQFDA